MLWFMNSKKYSFNLEKGDRLKLKDLLASGTLPVREAKRALCLQNLNNGRTHEDIADFLGLTSKAIYNISRRYRNYGLSRAIHDGIIPGNAPLLSRDQGNKIIAMVTGPPPDGFERWSVRLIASEAKVRKIVESIGKDTVHKLLKSHDLKPWREKNVVRG